MKKLILAATFVLSLGLAACGTSGSTQVNTQTTPTAAPQQGNVFTSIKDALSKSVSLKCEYPNPNGNGTKVTTYIKNGAVRVTNTATTTAKNSEAIMKNNQMWIWTDGDKKGMVMSFNPQEIADKVAQSHPTTTPSQQANNNQGASVLGDLEKYKQYCGASVVADSLFVPPTDVEFSDLSKIMQNAGGDILKNLPSGIPNIPGTQTPPNGY